LCPSFKERVDRALADKDEYITHLQEEVEQLKEELERSHLENKEFREKLERIEK
jgi:predicted RNase H-like nuclease (RuvC/YqgF family)